MKTARNHSLNLLSQDITRKCTHSSFPFIIFIKGEPTDRKLATMPPRVPVSLRQYEDRNASQSKKHRRTQSRDAKDSFSTLYCADIPGTKPKGIPPAIQKSYSSLRNDDIAGTKPRMHYCKSQRSSFSLRTDDIAGANTYKAF